MVGQMEVIPADEYDSWAKAKSEGKLKEQQEAMDAATASVAN
jgi:heme/copper-type cytochrome/quinol oxidase subunit 2